MPVRVRRRMPATLSEKELHDDLVIFQPANPDLPRQAPTLAKAQSPVEALCSGVRSTDLNHKLVKITFAGEIEGSVKECLADALTPPLRSQERAELTDVRHGMERRSPEFQRLVTDHGIAPGLCHVDRLSR